MRKMTLMSGFCLSILFTLAANQGLAANGGGGTGGGHDIESHFRTATEKTVNELNEMSELAKEKLNPLLDPIQLQANLDIKGRFQPTCNTLDENGLPGPTLKFLMDHGKMAYVGVPGVSSNVISLDCRPELIAEWHRIFALSKPGDILFIIHEALRNNNIASEDEDNYGVSSSYLKAKALETKMSMQSISDLILNGRNKKCAIDIQQKFTSHEGCLFDLSCHSPHVRFSVDGKVIFDEDMDRPFAYSGRMNNEKATQYLLDPSNTHYQDLQQKIFKLYRTYSCN